LAKVLTLDSMLFMLMLRWMKWDIMLKRSKSHTNTFGKIRVDKEFLGWSNQVFEPKLSDCCAKATYGL